jgi:hypothetical protein
VVAIARPLSGALRIADTAIRIDAEGRFCLNDLHRAAGGEKRHQPSDWLRWGATCDLIAELSIPGNPGDKQNQPVAVRAGAPQTGGGTFACKELVYAYAMWISSAFSLKVIRAYDELVTRRAPAPALPDFTDPAAAAIAWRPTSAELPQGLAYPPQFLELVRARCP